MDAKLLIDWNLILNIIILGLSNLIDTYESIDLVFYLGHVWGVYGVRIFTPTDNCIKPMKPLVVAVGIQRKYIKAMWLNMTLSNNAPCSAITDSLTSC